MTATSDPLVKHDPPGEVAAPAAIPLAELLKAEKAPEKVREIGGRTDGLDPTRYGDWEKNGRCIDF